MSASLFPLQKGSIQTAWHIYIASTIRVSYGLDRFKYVVQDERKATFIQFVWLLSQQRLSKLELDRYVVWSTPECSLAKSRCVIIQSCLSFNLDKMSTISQTIFSIAFSWMTIFVFWFKFHWSLFVKLQLTISEHWFRYWLGAEQATSHYLNQCWPCSPTHICGSRGRWVTCGLVKLSFEHNELSHPIESCGMPFSSTP